MQQLMPADLLGQLNSYSTVCDFHLHFNKKTEWHFGPAPISENATDFQLLAARLITKGLGFDTNLYSPKDRDSKQVSPKLFHPSEKYPNLLSFRRMTPLDSIIIGNSANSISRVGGHRLRTAVEGGSAKISETWNRLHKLGFYRSKPFSPVELRLKYILAVRYKYVCQQLYYILQQDIEAYIPGEEGMKLKFHPEGSYDIREPSGQEILMSESTRDMKGKTLMQALREIDQIELYGPLMMNVLRTIGYATYEKPKMIEFMEPPAKSSKSLSKKSAK